MPEPFVSIVTPVYNGEKFLRDCIKGVLMQSYRHYEYIILDNASTDRTAAIIEEFSTKENKIKVYRNPSTLKIIDNWNESLKFTSPDSKWIKFAFADDILFPNCLEEMVKTGEKDHGIGLVSAYRIDDKKIANVGLSMEFDVFNGKQMLKEHILRRLHVCLSSPNSVMYRKAALDELNGFDNAYLHADSELALRILNKYNLGFVHQVLSWTGAHAGRGANYSFYHGIFTSERMKFGFEEINKYDGIFFNDEEIIEMSDVYANEIAMYIATHVVFFLWKDMRNLWSEAPTEVKKRMAVTIKRNWPTYLRKFIGSIVHYRKKIQPTFQS
jgi:glycosyltransferase involved in cell wall biosynthesis